MPTDQHVLEQAHRDLQQIYTIQDVDVKSIRPMAARPILAQDVKRELSEISSAPRQLSLPIGEEFVGFMSSFVLREPLQVVGFPPSIEAFLAGQRLHTVGQLLKSPVCERSDVLNPLKHYLGDRPLEAVDGVEYGPWLRSVIGPMAPLKAVIALESFNIQDLYSLIPSQRSEWRRLGSGARTAEAVATWESWRSGEVYERLMSTTQQVVNAYVKPWMRLQQGIALACELQERLEQLTPNPLFARQVITCFETAICGETFLLGRALCHADKGLFADGLETMTQYERMIECVQTYFYKDDIFYRFDQLIQYVQKEMARRWEEIDTLFIERALRLSPLFRVRKGPQGFLEIRQR